MNDPKGPLDLVGRAAARMDFDKLSAAPAPVPPEAPATRPIAAENAAPVAEATVSRREETPVVAPATAEVRHKKSGSGPLEIDFVSLQKDGFLTPETSNARLAEQFRLIKRPLLRIAFDSRGTENGMGHVVMVTSCHPEDGKTFVSTNLAISMAMERDLFVLVIDTDIRRLGLSKRLGVTDRPGIMDVLLNPNLSISDVMVRTNIPNLAIIPAGRAVEGATELFASQRMTKLVHEITSRYKDRIIVFDAPPVLAASEPGVLAAHVGQIVFVVKSGETPKRSIATALRLLEVCPDVHFTLNRVMQGSGDDSFGYYN